MWGNWSSKSSGAWKSRKDGSRIEYLPLDRRLLLRETVKRSEAPHQVHSVDADDWAIVKQLRERSEGDAVHWIVEGRDEDGRISDIKVGIPCGYALAIEEERHACAWCARKFTRMRTLSPDTQGMGVNLPGQSVRLCGQPSHVAS